MKKHLYNTKLGKIRWFIDRFGASEIFLKPARVVLAPVIIPTLPKKTFTFQKRELNYFYHKYNMTWASERCIEVPIGMMYLEDEPSDQVLEIGNVLSHYFPASHIILDKFERGRNVINQDIVGFDPIKLFNLILSISTFEHIGYDDESEGSSAEKILRALKSSRKLLKPGGRMVITIPIGYNPELDLLIEQNEVEANREIFLSRVGKIEWKESPKSDAMDRKYRTQFPYANAIMVAEFGPL